MNCSSCGRNDLKARPSGKLPRHKIDGEWCPGTEAKVPAINGAEDAPAQTAATPTKNETECEECGKLLPLLKSGKVRKHDNERTGKVCEQDPEKEQLCPVPDGCGRRVGVVRGKLAIHKDFKLNNRCPGSGKTLEEAAKIKIKAIARPSTAAPKKAPDPYRSMSPIAKSVFKATRLATQLHPNGWKGTIVKLGPVAELTLTRGKGATQEVMFIKWDAGACIGGDGNITHTYRGRTIAVRNANAVRIRSAMTPEQIASEYARVATRKATRVPRQKKANADAELPPLPFDKEKATDKDLVAAITGKTIAWHNTIANKTERETAVRVAVKPSKNGRNLVIRTHAGKERTVSVDKLVSVS